MINFGHGVMLDTIEKATKARTWRNNPDLNRYFRQSDLITERHQLKWIEHIQTDPTICMYSIIQGIKCVGVCGLTNIDPIHSKAEISCYTEDYKKPLLKKAIMTLIYHAFYDFDLHRLWGEIFEYNKTMIEVFEELNFKEEGRLKESYYKNGKYIDSIIFGLLRN